MENGNSSTHPFIIVHSYREPVNVLPSKRREAVIFLLLQNPILPSFSIHSRRCCHLHVYRAQKVQTSTPFLEMNPEHFHTCSICPWRTFDDFLFCFCSSPEIGIPQDSRPKSPQQKTTPKYLAKETKQKTQTLLLITGRQVFIEHVCQISALFSKKTAWTLAMYWVNLEW